MDPKLHSSNVTTGQVECTGAVRRVRIRGVYGTDFKDIDITIDSPRFGASRFQFRALWGKYLATRWVEIQRDDQVTLTFEDGKSFEPKRFDNHTRGTSYELNTGWTRAASIIDVLGNIAKAFKR